MNPFIKRWAPCALLILALLSACKEGFRDQDLRGYRALLKEHIYADYKQMYRLPAGDALLFPYITPGSQAYDSVLWDWDSWLSDVALRQILSDIGTEADRSEALVYERGCILNYLAYTSEEDGYMPMVVDGKSDPARTALQISTPPICTSRVLHSMPPCLSARRKVTRSGCGKDFPGCRRSSATTGSITGMPLQAFSIGRTTLPSAWTTTPPLSSALGGVLLRSTSIA